MRLSLTSVIYGGEGSVAHFMGLMFIGYANPALRPAAFTLGFMLIAVFDGLLIRMNRPAYTEAHVVAYPVEYIAGIALFNEGEFHAAHDAWEDRWRDDAGAAEKLFLQAMIQSAVAFHHLEIGRPGAARRMHQMAKEKFARLGVKCFMSLDLEDYQAQLDRALAWLSSVPDPRELEQPEIMLPVIRLLPEVMEYD